MDRIYSTILLIFSSLLLATSSYGTGVSTESPEAVADRLQTRYDAIGSLSFDFIQDTSGDMTGKPRKGSGKALFVKSTDKNYMRWDYSSPDRQVLVSDGTLFSMYFAKMQQMIVSPAESLNADLTYSFFAGGGVLKNDFTLLPADQEFQAEGPAGFSVLKLIPKKGQSQVQDIHLWVTAGSLIRRILIRDHFGTRTILNFKNIEINTLIDQDPGQLRALFTFEPPEGTEIIRQ